MKRSATWLSEMRRDVFSQTGEDGVIEAALALLPSRDRWCVEFGASDGVSMSNTRHLILNSGYSAVMIEGDRSRFGSLKLAYAGLQRVQALQGYVGFGEEDGLDQFLRGTPIPADFDFLSIDIDGNDYHVWHAMRMYRPKLVCIEFNPTIPTEVHFVQPADRNVFKGASLLALSNLGKQLGYELIAVLPFNALFVRREYFPLFGIEVNSPIALRTDNSYVTYLFSGYDGEIVLQGNNTLPWHHRLPITPVPFQRIPRLLRRYPGTFDWWDWQAWRVFRAWDRARSAGRAILNRLVRTLTG